MKNTDDIISVGLHEFEQNYTSMSRKTAIIKLSHQEDSWAATQFTD